MNAAPLYVLGLGPGDQACLTPQARAALERAECVAGYHLYLELTPPELLRGKTIIGTGMRHEEERCAAAVDAALARPLHGSGLLRRSRRLRPGRAGAGNARIPRAA